MVAFFLLLFGVVEAFGVPVLTAPGPWLDSGGTSAALVGLGLLWIDVLLPVPSSLVMVSNGALFGVVGGTALSLLGGLGAGLFAFYLGRRGGRLFDRLVPAAERAKADSLLARYGSVAIIATRPVPLLAETVGILAGASKPMSWGQVALATVVGNVPPALAYALTGASAVNLEDSFLVFGAVLLVAGIFFFASRKVAQ